MADRNTRELLDPQGITNPPRPLRTPVESGFATGGRQLAKNLNFAGGVKAVKGVGTNIKRALSAIDQEMQVGNKNVLGLSERDAFGHRPQVGASRGFDVPTPTGEQFGASRDFEGPPETIYGPASSDEEILFSDLPLIPGDPNITAREIIPQDGLDARLDRTATRRLGAGGEARGVTSVNGQPILEEGTLPLTTGFQNLSAGERELITASASELRAGQRGTGAGATAGGPPVDPRVEELSIAEQDLADMERREANPFAIGTQNQRVKRLRADLERGDRQLTPTEVTNRTLEDIGSTSPLAGIFAAGQGRQQARKLAGEATQRNTEADRNIKAQNALTGRITAEAGAAAAQAKAITGTLGKFKLNAEKLRQEGFNVDVLAPNRITTSTGGFVADIPDAQLKEFSEGLNATMGRAEDAAGRQLSDAQRDQITKDYAQKFEVIDPNAAPAEGA